MRSIYRTMHYLLATVAMLAISIPAFAYEVQVLEGKGSESKAMDNANYELAIKRLERRVKEDNRFVDIQLTNLCTAYVATGQLDKATDTCDRAVDAQGEFVGTAYNSRGVLHALKGDLIAAMEDFEKAEHESNYPEPRSDWGDLAPSMRRFTVETDSKNSIEIAARNHDATHKSLAAIRGREEALTVELKN